MRWVCATLLSVSFVTTAYAAPLKYLCDLLPKAKAAELMGTPVTMVYPADAPKYLLEQGYAVPIICLYIGGTSGLVAGVTMLPLPPGITTANFFPSAEHVQGLGVYAAFVPEQKMLTVMLPGNRAELAFTMQGSTDPNLKAVLMPLMKAAIPQIPPYVDQTPPPPPSKIFRGWIESGDPHTPIGTPPEQVHDLFLKGGMYFFVADGTGETQELDHWESGRGLDGLHIEVNGYFVPGQPYFHINNVVSVIKASDPKPAQPPK
jgi:hypothetical protein